MAVIPARPSAGLFLRLQYRPENMGEQRVTPQAFIAKWHGNPLSEKAGAQPFFLDLCDVLGVEKPNGPRRLDRRHRPARTWYKKIYSPTHLGHGVLQANGLTYK
jgi:hypothetical protein